MGRAADQQTTEAIAVDYVDDSNSQLDVTWHSRIMTVTPAYDCVKGRGHATGENDHRALSSASVEATIAPCAC